MNLPSPSFRESIPVYRFGFGFGFGRKGRIPLQVPKSGDGGGAPVGPPEVDSISPVRGPLGGGQSISINGSNFTGATDVTIGGVSATGITVVNSTLITCTTPAGAAGNASVEVTTPEGTNAPNTLYEYLNAPTLTSVAPSDGGEAGGTAVTLTGTNFLYATGVTFDGAAATSVVVVNATTITCNTPAGSAGTASVIVTTPGGSNGANTEFTYVAAPTLSSVSPNVGLTAGGTNVTLTGTGFTGATGVTFDGIAATSVTVVNDTTITCATPANSAGSASVIVTTPYGSNGANSAFTYGEVPTLSSVSPNTGLEAGGESVTLTGTNFTGATGVTFDGAAATDVVVVNSTTITCTTPAAFSAGPASVIVTTPYGSNGPNSAFTYLGVPQLDSVSPSTGAVAGGTNVTLSGLSFTGATGVTFDGAAATSVVVVNDTTITCTTPAGSAGTASVIVSTPRGSNGANSEFTYVAAPALTSVAPDTGATAGGTDVTLTGTGFTGATGVTFDGAAATGVTVVNDTEITCTTPAGSAGTASVIVTTPYGSNGANTAFTYVAAPTLTSVSPNEGSTAGGESVTLTGTGFTGATGVTFDGAAATSVVVVNSTTITCDTPAGAAGTASVIVTTPYGSNGANTAFTYEAPATPVLTSVSPATGNELGGTPVTLTGTGFTGATSVTFDGAAATSLVVVNDTTITCVTPSGTIGAASVIVTTPAGSNGANSEYEYVAAPAPSISYLSPDSGSVDGGTAVTIYGSGFMGTTSVTFDAVEADDLVVVNDFEITCTSPPGAAVGTNFDVVVTNAQGSDTNSTWDYTQGAPQVYSVFPGTGSTLGGESVSISGLYFTGATSVTFDGSNASNIVVVNDTTITCDTPGRFGPGLVDVAVQTSYGTSAPNTAFEYT